MTVTYLWL